MTPDDYCRQKTAASGSSFVPGFLFLSRAKKQAMRALYAFCREVDDVADECRDPALAVVKLAWWREEIERVFAGKAEHPVGRALMTATQAFPLGKENFLTIIDGMEMDARQNRYPDFESLSLYCYRVASVVGLLSAQIFGYRDEKTLSYAGHLGMAFQLTNIIRDVGEDAVRGRLYLPQDELARFRVAEADILQGRRTAEFVELMRFQAKRAEAFYDHALEVLPAIDRSSQRPGLVMASIYRALLQEIVDADFPVLEGRVRLAPMFKLWLALRAWAGGMPQG
ncbi:MAG: presqualene diphosphate synthase HpnD [Zoogloeaceae bacterium]|jgi:phytoene synthase|nr:presqualene diphosphate synthase HpnD [Zoogloeaceae bacterium]